MTILGPATATRETVEANLPVGATIRFREDMLPELWDTAIHYGVDPVGMVAQSGKETGWGTYLGQVLPEFYNTAGIKIRHQDLFPGVTDGDRPLAHQMFPNWRVGAHAHAQHLLAYCGRPVDGLVVDPRFTLVAPPFISMWSELGGRWAPSLTYGREVEAIMRTLQGVQ